MYLDKLKEMLSVTCGQEVSQATIWHMLHCQGFTMKKVGCPASAWWNKWPRPLQITRVAAERSAEKRLDYVARISRYEARQLIFVDESSVDRRTTYRGRAWSIRGTKAQRKAFFVRGKRWVERLLLWCMHRLRWYNPLVSLCFRLCHWKMDFCTVKLSRDPSAPTPSRYSFRTYLNTWSLSLDQIQ